MHAISTCTHIVRIRRPWASTCPRRTHRASPRTRATPPVPGYPIPTLTPGPSQRDRAAMAESARRDYDVILFGASGFTGQFVAEELYRLQGGERSSFKWAAAGRKEAKVRATLLGMVEVLHDLRIFSELLLFDMTQHLG